MVMREVMTKYGKLIGSPSNYSFVSVFRGIPYAKPPVGERRWKAPEPLDVPDDPEAVEPRVCHTFAKMCVQDIFPVDMGPNKEGYCYPEPMDEDSLYLNVWTPANSPDDKLPVMFWVHGGAYLGGHSYSSTMNGEVMGKNGVILVSIAYRLGSFGFLAHPDLTAESAEGTSGNFGMLDQIAALKWVYENIAAFGGDPDNITVFGQSAGAHSAQVLASSPLARPMINRIILESGASMAQSDLLPIRTLAEAEQLGVDALEAAGISSIEEARALDAIELCARMRPTGWIFGPGVVDGLRYTPNIDGYVLEEPISTTAVEGRLGDISIMTGHTEEGGLDFPMPLDKLPAWLEGFGDDAEELGKLMGVETQEDIDAINPTSFRGRLVTASNALGEVRAAQGKPVYYYHFARPLPGDGVGAMHSAELFYVFNNLTYNWRPYVGVDFEIANTLNAYWCNFARTGDPNGEGLPQWDAYDPAAPAKLYIKDGVGMVPVEIAPWQRLLIDIAKK